MNLLPEFRLPWKPPPLAVRRATLGNCRLYYDADEQVVGMEFICKLCARWRDECACDPQARQDATIESINRTLRGLK